MSNALAIAHVTQALALLIENNLRPEIDMAVSVETRRPPTEPPTEPTVTVFLYQVTPNASMRHHDLPTRASDGTLLKRPAAPLDLHYLITAYGEETELVGQRLIGCVVRTLHEIPVLPRELIEEAATRPHLEGSDLAESVQQVRFTPTQMDVDETSKLWGMLHQTPYSLSVVYTGALVFVEGRERPTPPPPVERHTVRAAPFGAPGAPQRPDLPEPGGETAAGAVAPAHAPGVSSGGSRTGTAPASGAARTSAPADADAPAPEQKPTAPTAAKKRTAAKTPAQRGDSSTSAKRTRKTPATRGGGRSGAKSDDTAAARSTPQVTEESEGSGGSEEA